jgi:hypothetical protein
MISVWAPKIFSGRRSCHFEDEETIHEELYGTKNWQKLLGKFFLSALKNDCLAQGTPRDPKLSLESPGDENFRYLRTFFYGICE